MLVDMWITIDRHVDNCYNTDEGSVVPDQPRKGGPALGQRMNTAPL